MARWLGIDHGTRRIGVAVGDTEDGLAMPLKVLPAAPEGPLLEDIAQLARDHQAVGFVVGWPCNDDDSEGPQARLARAFAERLAAATRLDTRLWDERLSSFAADRSLAGHLTRGKRRQRQDAIAAAEFLRDFLASDGPATAERVG